MLIVGVMLLIMLSIVYTSWRNGISPMPSSIHVRHAVAKEVNRIHNPGRGTMVDAGSGFGTLAVHMALHCPGWKVTGIENSPVPLWISRVYWRFVKALKRKSLDSTLTFMNSNLYTYSYVDVDLIVCYLYPGAMKQLSGIANDHLTSGTRIISICFALPGWVPERTVTCRDLYRTKVYVYEI